jgi:hypothetical protein
MIRSDNMAKRKTLPENMSEIIESGDMEAFEEVFEDCELDAKTERGKETTNILSMDGLSVKHVRFLVESGFDLNSDCGYGYPAIAFQAGNRAVLKYMVQSGANINCVLDENNGSALFYAAMNNDARAVKNLLDFGASITPTKKYSKSSLLDKLLSTCSNSQIVDRLVVTKLLLGAGAVPTKETKQYASAIVENFENYREEINKDELNKYNKSNKELAGIFGVEVAPKTPEVNEPDKKIVVTKENWWEQFNELWNSLVPRRGPADTLQGEILRIIGKLSYEILDNGGENWDKDFQKMVWALQDYFSIPNDKAPGLAKEAVSLAGKLGKKSKAEDLDRLTEIAVKWIVANSEPLPLVKAEYER